MQIVHNGVLIPFSYLLVVPFVVATLIYIGYAIGSSGAEREKNREAKKLQDLYSGRI